MRILFVGLGSIARRHIGNLRSVMPRSEIAILREHSKDLDVKEIKGLVNNVFIRRSDAYAWKPEVVFITNPSSKHIACALDFIKRDCHLFIEKPLSLSLSGVDRLMREAKKRKRVVMVGYCLRYLKPLIVLRNAIREGKIGKVLSIQISVGQNLSQWRSGDYRTHSTALKKLSGGVIFELSHELDYARWLLGEPKEVSAISKKISDLAIETEDLAQISLMFKDKGVAHIHMDMVDQARNRSCRVVGTKGTLLWEFANDAHSVRFYSGQKKQWTTLGRFGLEANRKVYIDEVRHFFDCIRKHRNPSIDLKEGLKTLKLILAVQKAVQTKRTVIL